MKKSTVERLLRTLWARRWRGRRRRASSEAGRRRRSSTATSRRSASRAPAHGRSSLPGARSVASPDRRHHGKSQRQYWIICPSPDQRSTSDRPRTRAGVHRCRWRWLRHAARLTAADNVTTETYCYGHQSILTGRHSIRSCIAHTCLH